MTFMRISHKGEASQPRQGGLASGREIFILKLFFEFLIVLFVLDKLFYVLGRTLGFLIPIQNTIMAPPR